MKYLKITLISLFAITAVIGWCIAGCFSYHNTAISMEEQVNTAFSDIDVYQKRRVDLLYNLADAVKSYNKHESEVIVELAKARGPKENSNQQVNASAYIQAVAERYPELKANQNYRQYMTELAMTENKIAAVRENYNQSVKEYKRYVRSFPASLFLSITGYEFHNFEYLKYNAPADAPRNLL
jgi:LemA protein